MRPLLVAPTLAALAIVALIVPISLVYLNTSDVQSPTPVPGHEDPKHVANVANVVNVVLLGATGDLAAKYLWVAMFRMAFEAAATTDRVLRFFAGASNSIERGRAWHQKFFDESFAERVCGASEDKEKIAMARTRCLKFLEDEFKPSVSYMPLRTETQYRDLGIVLDERKKQLSEGSREEGRMVYLAIPPPFFLQSCELVHRYLRPRSTGEEGDPFLRVVVEKPFGRDLESARELATHLRRIYSDQELYVMDHYAGKPVVHALRRYFQLNAAALHPIWNTQHIRDVHIEMTETATVKNRVNYFDSTGIIRDVMVNHLQLLFNVVVAPSFNPAIYDPSVSSSDFARDLHEAQLRFVGGLKWSIDNQPDSLFVAQYDEYDTHYRAEIGHEQDASDHFTSTAAKVEFSSVLEEWRNTTFHVAAAKASEKRLLAVTVNFRDGVFREDCQDTCTLTITFQLALNADTRQSHRIEWSCDLKRVLKSAQLPEGWGYLNSHDQRVITPMQASSLSENSGYDVAMWELGDERSAYDILLDKVAVGATEHFADLDEVEAAWSLWTPIVQTAENIVEAHQVQKSRLERASYPAGTSPWKSMSALEATSQEVAREEL